MLKRFRLIFVCVFSLSIFLRSPFSKIFVYSLNVSDTRNVPLRQLLREEQAEMPILFNLTLDYIIPRRRLLDDTTADVNSSNIKNSTILDGSNNLIDPIKDNDTFIIETTWTIDPIPTLPSISNNIESFSSTPEPQEAVTHVRRKRNVLTDQNHLEQKEETEENEKIDKKRSSVAEKMQKIASTDEQDEVPNVQNSEDDELDDYNAVDEKSPVDAEESNENEENLEEDGSQEETASQLKDSKMKRESSDYEYVDDQENSSNDVSDKKMAGDVRVKRDEAESVKVRDGNIKLDDNTANEGKISESGNVESNSKEEETSGKIVDNENQDSKVPVVENQDSKELDSKRDALKNKVNSVESSKEAAVSTNSGKDNSVVADTKSKEEQRGTRTAPENNDNYEKRVEEQIKRKIDSIKEEIKREIERKRRDREIERNNAKFDELQSRDSDQEEGESLETGQNLDDGLQSKRSAENSKEMPSGKRKRRSNENELTRQQLEEIEGVENLKDEDYRLAGLTHESIQKRFAPVYEEVSKDEEEEDTKVSLNKAPVKKREKVRQMFIVKEEGKQKRKKRREIREPKKIKGARQIKHAKNAKIQGKKQKRKVSSTRQVLVPEQARVKIVEELPRDLTLDPRLRRSLPFNKEKQVRTKRENGRLEGKMVDLEYRPQNVEDEENDEGNEFGDDGFEDRTSNLRDGGSNSLTDRRLYEEQEGEENDQPLNFLFSGIHD